MLSKERFPLAWRLLFFYYKNSITTSNQCGNFVLYTFLEKGGEQDENSRLGNENLKGVHIDGVIEEIRNPTLFQLEMIAIALGVKITDLFESEYK